MADLASYVEQAEGLDSVKKAKQFFREIDKRNG